MGKYEDVLRELRSEGLDHFADALEPFSATELRKKAERTDAAERRVADLEGELDRIKVLPKKQEVLRSMNVDFESLRPAELREIERATAEKYDETWAELFIEENKLPVAAQRSVREDTGASRIADMARSAPAGGSVPGGAISPDEIGSWPMQARVSWMRQYPDAWAALQDGKEVTGVPRP